MEVALLTARLFLASIFGVAAVAKAIDRAGSRQSLIDFGVPESLATPVGRGLPYVELLIALALIPKGTAWFGAIGAFVLLLIFIAAIGLSLARGRSPDCRCFGQLYSKAVGLSTFARNLALAAVSGFVIVQGRDDPGLSALGWLSDLTAGETVNLVFAVFAISLLAAAIVFLKRVLKQQERLFAGMEAIKASLDEDGQPAPVVRTDTVLPEDGLPVGAFAPKFSLPDIDGDETSLDDLLGYSKSVLLLFTGPNCWGCKLLLPAVRAWQRDYSDKLSVAVLSNGALDEVREKMLKYEIDNVLLDEKSSIADEYQAAWTPAAVLINSDGKIASRVKFGDNAIREWFRNFLASGQLQSSASNGKRANGDLPQVAVRYSVREIGEAAPKFSLSDLTGKAVEVDDLLGGPTLLLFWHPRCEYAQAMRDDIRRLEGNPAEGAPKFVFIVAGEAEDIMALVGVFKSPVLLDPEFEIGPLFGTKVTPSAILIDDEGRIASGLAMGYQNVRALIGLPKAEPELTAQV